MKTFLSCCVIALYFAYTQACSESAAQKCFEDMGRTLGLNQNNQQINSDLFALVNPSAANNNQQQTCNALKGYDFTTPKTCIRTAGCADTNIIPNSVQGMPTITYIMILDMLKGLCEPGCENMESKNTEVQKCSQNMGGNDQCKAMEDAFSCFRNIIGKCEVLVKFTESFLQSSGVLDTAKQQCPDLQLSLTADAMAVTTSKVAVLAFALLALLFTWN